MVEQPVSQQLLERDLLRIGISTVDYLECKVYLTDGPRNVIGRVGRRAGRKTGAQHACKLGLDSYRGSCEAQGVSVATHDAIGVNGRDYPLARFGQCAFPSAHFFPGQHTDMLLYLEALLQAQ
ncbi:hypothetical protein D3C81_1768830 [compost metagenome]